MSSELLHTKLFVPRLRPFFVPRPHLIQTLNEGLHGKLTLVSAPAGFGKTTLITSWLQEVTRPVAWLALSEDDREPAQFLTYLIASLQTIDPQIGATLAPLLQSTPQLSLKAMLTPLLNQVAAQPTPSLLVLDDYHRLDSPAIHEGVTYFVDHLPPQLHLVITTREDPPLPLARLRARGEMTELRAADLRFSGKETAAFLTHTMRLSLTDRAIAALEERTEGWVAGLQLAGLSLQGQSDPTSFIDDFSGSHRYILDYLLEEVLEQLPNDTLTFLLQTAVFDRLCGPFCDAILEQADGFGQTMLAELEQANLFLIPLDNNRYWYRYHHLFADLLRQRSQQTGSMTTRIERFLRASHWFEANGFELEAFHFATAANDVPRAQALALGAGMPLYYRGYVAPVLNWLDDLPKETIAADPSLAVMRAAVLTIAGQNSQVEPLLDAAEKQLETAVSTPENRDLLGQIATIRARLAGPEYAVNTITTQANRALDHLHPGNLPDRTAVTRALGIAYHFQGNRPAAQEAYQKAIALSQASDNRFVNILATTGLGIIQESNNQLNLAADSYQQVLSLSGDPPIPAACEALLGLARIAYLRNELEQANATVQRARALAQQIENIDTTAECDVLQAQIKLANGALEEASELLTQAEQFVERHKFVTMLPKITAVKVQLFLREGALANAQQAAADAAPLTQARLQLAQGDPKTAVLLTEKAQTDAREKAWPDELLQAQLLAAIAHEANGNHEKAKTLLNACLTQAEPSGMIRLFVDEGLPLRRLLKKLPAKPHFVAQLLTAMGEQPTERQPSQPLPDPLSERELEVLRLVADGLTNRQIAERLYLALSTVKGHNRIIFSKLNVSRRTEAIARARALGIL